MPSGRVIAASTMISCQPQKVKRHEGPAEQPGLAGALHDVVGRREQRRAAEGEDHRVGVQGPQAAVGEERDAVPQDEIGEGKLGGHDDPHQHADDTPDHRHDGELAYDGVVIRF